MKRYLGYAVLLALSACGGNDKKAKVTDQPQVALAKSANSDAFTRSFGQLLEDYYSLKDDLVAEKDTAGINVSAKKLRRSVDSLHLAELKADSNIVSTAKTYTLGMSDEITGLLGETNIENKRKSFQILSDQLYDLVRTVQYSGSVIYHDFCPMAFNDQGAYWLSNSAGIRNPYIPKKMISCGEVRDSIDFRSKN